MPIISALKRLRKEDLKFEASLGYMGEERKEGETTIFVIQIFVFCLLIYQLIYIFEIFNIFYIGQCIFYLVIQNKSFKSKF
jgi:hypothetical protein